MLILYKRCLVTERNIVSPTKNVKCKKQNMAARALAIVHPRSYIERRLSPQGALTNDFINAMATQTNAVNWFEIPVNDMERAKKFYEAVFGVQLSVLDAGQLSMALFPNTPGGPGAGGSIVKGKTYVPSHAGSMVYFRVDDIEATLGKIAKSGGKILSPKVSIGEYGFVGHFEDCEGNRVALHTPK